MVLRLPLLLVALLCVTVSARAELPLGPTSFETPLSLSEPLQPWKFMAGDRPEWAAPDLDDDNWPQWDSTFAEVPPEWRGIGWLRLTLQVDSKLVGRRLGVWSSQLGAAELYVDGRRRARWGDVDRARTGERTAVTLVPRHPALVTFERAGRHVIAIRFASTKCRWIERMGLPCGPSVRVGPWEQGNASTQRMLRWGSTGPNMLSGGALVLTLLHLLLFFAFRDKPENLYLAVVTASMGGVAWSTTNIGYQTEFGGVLVHHLAFKLSVLVLVVSLLRFYYEIFHVRLSWRYRVVFVISVLLGLSAYYLPVPYLYIFASLVVFVDLRVVVQAVRDKKDGAWIIAAGGAFFAVGVLVQMVPDIVQDAPRNGQAYLVGFFALLISMSVYLARDIATTHSELSLLRKLDAAHRELQETQAKLMQSEKMAALGQLVAGIAHEINTPVGAIHSVRDSISRATAKLRDTLVKDYPEAANSRGVERPLKVLDDSAHVIETGSTRVAELVSRLKRFARLDEAELQRVDIHVGLEDALLLMRHEIKHDVNVHKEYGDLPLLLCYPSQLNQVFLNILINAVQAMEGKGELTIRTEHDGGVVRVAIGDTGKGIAPEDMKHIFDPGFTTKGVGVGTGLGLSICYQIVQAHKGSIRAESQPGKGTTFTVELPLSNTMQSAHA